MHDAERAHATTPIRVHYGGLGLVLGLAVASCFLADGCTFDAEQSLRLRVAAPVLTLALGLALAECTRRGMGLWRTVSSCAGALVVWAFALSMIHDPASAPEMLGMALAMQAPTTIAVLVFVPWAHATLGRARRARGPVRAALTALGHVVVATTAALGAGTTLATHASAPLDLQLAAAATLGSAVEALVAVWFLRLTVCAARALAALPAVPADAAEVDVLAAGHVVDFGVGDELRASPEPQGAPFRGAHGTWRGDRAAATRTVRRAGVAAGISMVLAIVGVLLCGWAMRVSPPWRPPATPSFSWGGC